MCQLTPKLIYIHSNKVLCTFLPNFIPKINKTGILWYRGILWYIYLYMLHQNCHISTENILAANFMTCVSLLAAPLESSYIYQYECHEIFLFKYRQIYHMLEFHFLGRLMRKREGLAPPPPPPPVKLGGLKFQYR